MLLLMVELQAEVTDCHWFTLRELLKISLRNEWRKQLACPLTADLAKSTKAWKIKSKTSLNLTLEPKKISALPTKPAISFSVAQVLFYIAGRLLPPPVSFGLALISLH